MSFVLIHGGLNTGRCWQALSPLLSEPAFALDLPGRAGRPADHASISLKANARDVIEQMDAAAIDRAHLVGHSLGGATIISVAAIAPERVASLTFVAAPVPKDGATVFSVLGEAAQGFIGHHRTLGDASLPVPPPGQSSAVGKEPGVPEAVSPFFDPVPVGEIAGVTMVNYVRTAKDGALDPALQDLAIANLELFGPVRVLQCDSDHMPMSSALNLLAAILNDIAATTAKEPR